MTNSDMKTGTGERTTSAEEEVARIEAMINTPAMRDMKRRNQVATGKTLRPKNAATLVLLDGKPGNFKVLMGRRNKNLKFMPGALVFPGGSVDRYDGSVPAVGDLDEVTVSQLLKNMRGRPTRRGARALALAAIRETAEESGLLIGKHQHFDAPSIAHEYWSFFDTREITPAFDGFSLLARAITPPGPPRRFDTWFFVAKTDCVAHVPEGGFDPCGELEDLQWISPDDAIKADTREITRVMLVELMQRLDNDPDLTPGYPAPFYYSVNNRFHKDMMHP